MVNPRGTVLVTRPEPGGSQTAAVLEARGFAALALPLTETRALPARLPAGDFAQVVATSANAVRHADEALLEKLRGLPTIVVGLRTAEIFREAGFRQVEASGGTALALADRLLAQDAAGRVLYLCGRPRRAELEARLRAAGRDFVAVETYETLRRRLDEAEVSLLHDRPVDAVLVYSPESAKALEAALPLLVRRRLRFFCLSEAVAAALPPGCSAHVSQTPDEAALLALLEARI